MKHQSSFTRCFIYLVAISSVIFQEESFFFSFKMFSYCMFLLLFVVGRVWCFRMKCKFKEWDRLESKLERSSFFSKNLQSSEQMTENNRMLFFSFFLTHLLVTRFFMCVNAQKKDYMNICS